MFKGFKTRLILELERLIATSQYEELAGLKGTFAYINCQYPANYVCWLGGSIESTLEHISSRSVSLEQYQAKYSKK